MTDNNFMLYVPDVSYNNNYNNNVVSSYLLKSAFLNNFPKSNSDLNKSGVPSSMRNMP